MDMSPACEAPRQPAINNTDRTHPKFREYQLFRTACAGMLIEAPSFANWLHQNEVQGRADYIATHSQFPDFQAWMQETQGGARTCPAGSFPANFLYWLEGGRW